MEGALPLHTGSMFFWGRSALANAKQGKICALGSVGPTASYRPSHYSDSVYSDS